MEIPTVEKNGISYVVIHNEEIKRIKERNIINAKTAMIANILDRLNIQYKLFENKDVEEKYLNKKIASIFKIIDKNGFENDLIVSDISAQNFIASFDFEICKCYIELETKNKSISYNEFLNNIVCLPSMLRDLDEKTLTIKVKNFNMEEIEYFMNKHYLKLKEKFPDYKLNYFESKTNQENMRLNEIKYLNYLMMKESLNNNKKVEKNKI